MNGVDQYDKRISAVEREISAVSSQVHSLASTVGEMAATQRGLAERFDRVADAFEEYRNTPGEWSTKDVIRAVAGSVLTVAIAVAGLFYGLAGYVDMTTKQNEADIAILAEWRKDKDAFQREMHHEVGINDTVQTVQNTEIERLWNHIHKLENEDKKHVEIMAENKAAISAAEVSRRAIGDYVKELHSEVSQRLQ